jgi:hypothetical protein
MHIECSVLTCQDTTKSVTSFSSEAMQINLRKFSEISAKFEISRTFCEAQDTICAVVLGVFEIIVRYVRQPAHDR